MNLMNPNPGTGRDPAPVLDPREPIEIMKDFDTILLYGQLVQVSPSALTVKRAPGEPDFPLMDTGSIVLVRGYDKKVNPMLFLGSVVHSSGEECTVGSLRCILYHTLRKLARHPLYPPYEIRILAAEASEPQPGLLLNISASGACVVSGYTYPVGQTLSLVVLTDSGAEQSVFRCMVVRATPWRRGRIEYGLLFIELTPELRGSLNQIIAAFQAETQKKFLF